ncbi:MAG: sulfite exporter TauE/SafE family protein [Xanthobacteraceae bacterium]
MTIITDPLFYLLAVPAILLLGLGKGGFAGVGMISTPLLALTMPPLQAAAILLPILLCQDVISVWAYRREWSAWNLKVLLPGSAVGVGAAWLFAAYVPNAYVEIAVGATGICFVLYMFLAHVPKEPQRPSALAGMFWGSLAGFTSTIIQVGAPPYQVHILPQRLDKLTLIGTTIIFFALVNVMKLVPYFALGQFSSRTLATSAVLLPFAIACNFLGLWLARRTPTEMFYKITYLLMLVISLALMWQGAAAVLAD